MDYKIKRPIGILRIFATQNSCDKCPRHSSIEPCIYKVSIDGEEKGYFCEEHIVPYQMLRTIIESSGDRPILIGYNRMKKSGRNRNL